MSFVAVQSWIELHRVPILLRPKPTAWFPRSIVEVLQFSLQSGDLLLYNFYAKQLDLSLAPSLLGIQISIIKCSKYGMLHSILNEY